MKRYFWVSLFGMIAFATHATTILSTNSVWQYFRGTGEASSPDPTAWRAAVFDDSNWSTGAAPFYYDTDTSPDGYTGNTQLPDMQGGYTCIFLREVLVLTNVASFSEMQIAARSADGFIAWINGTEVARFNMPEGEPTCTGTSSSALPKPVPIQNFVVNNPADFLTTGTNVVAVQAFSSCLASSNFLFWLTLDYSPHTSPPAAVSIPAPGATVGDLHSVAVEFNEAVTNVSATDLLINGSPATNLTAFTLSQYVFEFPRPPFGTVQMEWAAEQSIMDLAGNAFSGGNWIYTLDSNAPALSVQISEFMTDNRNSIRDEDGAHSGWIELLNPADENVNLKGWALTDDPANLRKWVLPNVSVEGQSYLLVFASGKDRTNATSPLHANFQLSASGGFLALVDAQTNIISAFSPTFPPQQPDVSFGRDRISPDVTGFFATPTPEAPNPKVGAGFAPEVQFSRAGGTFLSAFPLQLTATSETATIRFTLDGSAPTESSLRYTEPLTVSASVQVRARTFAPGLFPGPLQSESYLLLDQSLALTNSDLPAIVICNFNGGAVPDYAHQPANFSIYEPQAGITWLTNAPTLSVRGSLHVRGWSTRHLPKQSYTVEFWNEFNDDEDYSPLGLPAHSDWVLYAPNNLEPVLLHNPLAYQLSNEIGRYASRTRFVEVYLKTDGAPVSPADYNGIYVLEEKVKRDGNRVAVEKLEPKDTTLPAIAGGYVMSIDLPDPGEFGFYAAGQTINYVYPKEADLKTGQREPQKTYLQNYMDAFGAALSSDAYKDPTNGFRAYLDVDSCVDYHILNVTAFNVDATMMSTYFYKPRNGKIFFGPVWDFDRSQGSVDYRVFNPLVWRCALGEGADFFNNGWWGRLFTDVDFWQQWIDRYQVLRTDVLSTNHIFTAIDALASQVRRQQPREVERWPGFTTPRSGTFSYDSYSYTFPGTYQGELDFLKSWYADRLNFMDTNFLARPVFNQNGGAVPPGFALTMAAPIGATIYYTTNGSDPRLSGGGIAPDARVYDSPIMLLSDATFLARAYDLNHHNLTGPNNPPLDSPWSGLRSATFITVLSPIVTVAPVSLAAYPGQSVTFSVSASGLPQPTYQWAFNGTNIADATNAQLTVAVVQTNQAGVYSVFVSNPAGNTNLSATLTVTPKPNLVITEVMSSEASGVAGHQDWWELSNLDSFSLNLRGYRFDDDSASLAPAYTITNDVTIAPGESIVFVENLTPDAFREWWGPQNLRPGLKIITYVGSGLGLSATSDQINLWNAVANANTDKIASVSFLVATRGVSFGYDPASHVFGGLSAVGVNGAFMAAVNGDIGSPGVIVNQPRIAALSLEGDGLNLTFITQPGRIHRVEYKGNLDDETWTLLTNVLATTNPLTITEPGPLTNVSRFYRVVLLP